MATEHDETNDDKNELLDAIQEGIGSELKDDDLPLGYEPPAPADNDDSDQDPDEDPAPGSDEEDTSNADEAEDRLAEGDKDAAGEKDKGREDEEELQLELSEEDRKQLSQPAQQRFHRLANAVKERDTKLEQAQSSIQQMEETLSGWREVIQGTQLQQDELLDLLEFGRSLKTGNYDAAQKFLNGYASELQLGTGKRFEAADPLAEFDDLRDKVDQLVLGEEDALEIARHRRQQARAEQSQQAEHEQLQATQSYRSQAQSVVQEVNAWETAIAEKDIDYPAKQKIIAEQLPGIIQRNVQAGTPTNILHEVKTLYEALGKISAPTPSRAPGKDQQPLRTGGRSSGSREPSSMQDAILQSLNIS